MKIAFDTSVLVAAAVGNHPRHEEAITQVELARQEEHTGVVCTHALGCAGAICSAYYAPGVELEVRAPKTSAAQKLPRGAELAVALSSVPVAVNPKEPISTIPRAPVGSLDLDQDADEERWEREVMDQAAGRIASSRARLERLGVINERGEIVDRQLPPDMQPGSSTSLETG